ncbi:hypothetical protein [Paenibacillus contaminans]|uniref:Uncharacterized protein n=1 Tax=Paenibacillus contaminans TaxID=450362 RepID=A0A329ML24_9BACL|nr:hypothetical protein [Paenibacillus contaminans]RAV19413.1 hypothetical protein DQG23_20680 [Paenibacillus contaminans]
MEDVKKYKQIDLYFDEKKQMVYILPIGWHSMLGIVEIGIVEHLNLPLDSSILLNKVNLCFDLCYSISPPMYPAKESPLANFLGVRNYREATKNKKLVVITWELEKGYIVYPHSKERSGGYNRLEQFGHLLGNNLNNGFDLLSVVIDSINKSSI